MAVPVAAVTVLSSAALLLPLLFRRLRSDLALFEAKPTISTLLPLAVFALICWKVSQTEIWSWDHYAIWGVKSRRLFTLGWLDTSFLHSLSFTPAAAHYPLGQPMLTRFATFGAMPEPTFFKLFHLLQLGLIAAFFRKAVVFSASCVTADVATATLMLSPLFWDTESMGLADVTLALFAMGAIALLSAPLTNRTAVQAGAMAAALPWIKEEGIPLAVLLTLAWWAAAPTSRRKSLTTALPAAISAGSILAQRIAATALPAGQSFLAGEWQERAVERLLHPGAIVGRSLSELTAADFLGLWVVAAIALPIAIARKRRRAGALLLAGGAQLTLYLSVYLVSYIEPELHIDSSLHRIAAAILPIVALGSVDAFGRDNQTSGNLHVVTGEPDGLQP